MSYQCRADVEVRLRLTLLQLVAENVQRSSRLVVCPFDTLRRQTLILCPQTAILVLAAQLHATASSLSVDADHEPSRSSSAVTSEGGGLSLPLTKFDKYDIRVLNSIHSRLGGVTYVLKALRTLLAAQPTPSGGGKATRSTSRRSEELPDSSRVTARRADDWGASGRSESESLLDVLNTAKESGPASRRSGGHQPKGEAAAAKRSTPFRSTQAGSSGVQWEDVRKAQLVKALADISEADLGNE